MKLIAVTTERFFDGEADGVTALFEEGLERLHLRKPEAAVAEITKWLTAIPEVFHNRIVLHSHFGLTANFQLGGTHLNRHNPLPINQKGSVSRSCHSIAEIKESYGLDYYFLSPVFDSVSKAGYRSAIDLGEVAEAFRQKALPAEVYALGGITPNRVQQVKQAGFAGVAVLGALWGAFPTDNNIDALITRYQLLINSK